MMVDRAEKVVVGRIVALYGVKGWVKVRSYTDPQENITNYNPWQLKSGAEWKTFNLEAGRLHGKGIIAKIAGIDDRDQAAGLLRSDIAILREQLPELEGKEYYWRDLEGLRVLNVSGVDLGLVDHLFETGANDVLVVRKDATEVLIPFLMDSVVLSVDLKNRVMQVDWHLED